MHKGESFQNRDSSYVNFLTEIAPGTALAVFAFA